MADLRKVALALATAGLLSSGAAQAALQDRGGGLLYDTVLNVTWLQDANYAKTIGYAPADSEGRMSWPTAVTWANSLVYGGFDDWRLPYASVSAGIGPITTLLAKGVDNPCSNGEVACRDNELAYMLYYNLGGQYHDDQKVGTQIVNGVSIFHIQSNYWSGTEYDATQAWNFYFYNGSQQHDTKSEFIPWAWAVRDGDVTAPVPEPESYAMMLAGLGILGFMARRRRL